MPTGDLVSCRYIALSLCCRFNSSRVDVLMPTNDDFVYARRYNSLRLNGHDYAQTNSLYFITIDAFESRPLFGDLILAKRTLSSLLHPNLSAVIRVHAFTLMPEHLHLLAGVCKPGRRLFAWLVQELQYKGLLETKPGNSRERSRGAAAIFGC